MILCDYCGSAFIRLKNPLNIFRPSNSCHRYDSSYHPEPVKQLKQYYFIDPSFLYLTDGLRTVRLILFAF